MMTKPFSKRITKLITAAIVLLITALRILAAQTNVGGPLRSPPRPLAVSALLPQGLASDPVAGVAGLEKPGDLRFLRLTLVLH